VPLGSTQSYGHTHAVEEVWIYPERLVGTGQGLSEFLEELVLVCLIQKCLLCGLNLLV